MSVPSLRELTAMVSAVSIPLAMPFRGITHREALIFDAPDGPAEWSPFLEYDDAEAATWLACTLEQGFGQAAVPPATTPALIAVNGTVPAMDPADIPSYLEQIGSPSCVKIKVGGPGSTRASDVARVRAVREALGVTGRIRIDANGSWTLDEAEHAVREMEPFDIDYVEQPVESVSDMAVLRMRIQRLGIAVAADESIRRSSDIDTVLEAEACDVVVIKVQPLGGIQRALEIIAKAQDAGCEVVVSSALETSVGLHYGARLQQILMNTGLPVHDAGLGTASFLTADVVHQPLLADGGTLTLTPLELDHESLRHHATSDERREWWLARLERCLALR
jgi:O-succinylbenzoate synthase